MADPGNVGTLIRTADAFGAAVALSDGLRRPDRAEGAARLGRARSGACRCCAFEAARVGGSRSSRAAASRSARSTCAARSTFLLGAEREGLPAELERDAEAWIPIGGAESLNVAVAGAIALYEWRRQNADGGA